LNRLVVSPQAYDDLIEIHDYIADKSPKTARQFIDSIEEQFIKIAHHPRLGVNRPMFGQSIRMVVINSYLIFYQIQNQTVEIVHVYHTKRNISSISENE
jgi:addiction module RelE/StbE family toxin